MQLTGNPVSEGVAIGKIKRYLPQEYIGREGWFDGDAGYYLQTFQRAKVSAIEELDRLISSFLPEQQEQAMIFSAHKELLDDEELADSVFAMIQDEHALPEYAVEKTVEEFSNILSGVDDPLIAARVSDLKDIKQRLIRNLRGEAEQNLSCLSEPIILVAHDLLPSDTATMDLEHVLGIVTEIGSTTSHSAILARSFRIPAILGFDNALEMLEDGTLVALDALDGVVIVDPTDEQVSAMEIKRSAFLQHRAKEDAFRNADPLTGDGVRIDIGINIGADPEIEDYSLCDFIGLFRTEFLYMEQNHMPTEEEQYQVYAEVLRMAKGKPVTLRTLDIGGDKTLPYMELPKEQNPFLGKRALRLCLEHMEMFKTQLRAVLRASVIGPIWLMFPMVGSLDDIRKAKAAVEEVKEELRAAGIPYDEGIKLGIMIEIPSIALIADQAAQEVDFASIGTNDLCQYTMAVDRMAPGLQDYYQNLSPAILRLLHMSISAFVSAGKPISVCGEMGGDPVSAVALVGMGLRKLSMNSVNIARIKAALSRINVLQAEEAVVKAMNCMTEQDARQELLKLLS